VAVFLHVHHCAEVTLVLVSIQRPHNGISTDESDDTECGTKKSGSQSLSTESSVCMIAAVAADIPKTYKVYGNKDLTQTPIPILPVRFLKILSNSPGSYIPYIIHN